MAATESSITPHVVVPKPRLKFGVPFELPAVARSGPTVGDLIRRYIDELEPVKPFGPTHITALRALMRTPIASKEAESLQPGDVIDHCRMRKAAGVCPATVNQDITFLRGPLGYAKGAWGLNVSTAAISDAMPLLKKYNLLGKSRPRSRRPSREEFDALIAYFKKQDHHHRTVIRMAVMMEFAVYSARRISEITRLRWGDVNHDKRTCIVRDMKDPKHKVGNHHEFPLLGRAWEIVMEQPRLDPNDPNERIFPFNHKSAGQRYTQAKKVLGIEDLRFHDLRREAASRLFEAGFSVQEVMLVTGHKTPAMLLRVYTKLHAEDLHKGPASVRAKAEIQ